MFANDDEDDEWNNESEKDQPQGYQALLDPDDEESITAEDEEIEDDHEEEEEIESIEEEVPIDDGQIKPFTCTLCTVSFSKFEGYREHFVSTEHRYKRRDEKKRLGEGCIIETSPVEVFVNLLLYNKIPFESIQINLQPVDFSVSGSLEYNNNKYEYQHASTLNDLYQVLTYLNFNQLSHEQRNGGIQQMVKTPDEYRLKYNLEPMTIENLQEDIVRFDTQLAQQVMHNIQNQQGNNNRFNRGGGGGRGRGRGGRGGQPFRGQGFRPRGGNFHQQNGQHFNPGQFNQPRHYQPRPFNPNQSYPQNNFHLPTSFRPPNQNFVNEYNKRPYPQNNNNNYNNNYYNPRQTWANKRPRFDQPHSHPPPPQYQQPSSSNRIDYRYVANQNTYQQQQFH
ncbi:unnamed protein product [Adineta steineri]|uniref:C2H2-type domain-containing protein n=1 Tax=Adineta steineri TaxID=433720 RepID=A0A813ZKJ7_9BILA|nr:unnamed protein product [Adineta steineri]